MKRIGKVVTSVVIAASLLAGCGSKEASFKVGDLGNDLNTKITYQDELMLLDVETASMFLNLSDISIVDSAIYEGSGATAEEIVVLECTSGDEAKKAEQMLKDRVEEQKESFKDYVPEELTKLDAAIVVTNGNYAVLSVSNDPDGANAIIKEYM